MNMKSLHFLIKIKDWFFRLSYVKQIILVVLVFGSIWFMFNKVTGSNKNKAQYQTSTVERGTLVVAVTGSGNVSTTNSTSVSTQATGVISEVYVKDGDTVKTGDKIAEIELDLLGQQRASQSLASYQSAKNNLEGARADMFTTQSTMFTKWKSFMDIAQNSTYQNADGTPNNNNRSLPEFHIAQDDWLATEAKYKNQQNIVNQAQTAVNTAWYSYQQNSSTVYAPISGTVTGLPYRAGW